MSKQLDPDALLTQFGELSVLAPRPDVRAPRNTGRLLGRAMASAAALGVLALVGSIALLALPQNGPAGRPEIRLPTHRDLGGGPTALMFGRLVQENECLYVASYRSGERHLVIWPQGSSLDGQGSAAVVTVPGVGPVAAVGEPIQLGGGEYGPDQLEFLRTLLDNEIPEQCVGGRYWLAVSAESVLAGSGPAEWRLDPAFEPGPASRLVQVLLTERACANGLTPEGRILVPELAYLEDAIHITLSVRSFKGADCPGNPEFPLTIDLAEPIGQRRLIDGSANATRWSPSQATGQPTDTPEPIGRTQPPETPRPTDPAAFERAEGLALEDPLLADYLVRHPHADPVAQSYQYPAALGQLKHVILVTLRFFDFADDYPLDACDISRPINRVIGSAWLIDPSGSEILARSPIWPDDIRCF